MQLELPTDSTTQIAHHQSSDNFSLCRSRPFLAEESHAHRPSRGSRPRPAKTNRALLAMARLFTNPLAGRLASGVRLLLLWGPDLFAGAPQSLIAPSAAPLACMPQIMMNKYYPVLQQYCTSIAKAFSLHSPDANTTLLEQSARCIWWVCT